MTVGSGLALNPGETSLPKIVTAVRQLMEGRSNAVGTFTLAGLGTSTTVTSPNVGTNSTIVWTPITTSAATVALNNMYLSSVGPGTFTITHNSLNNFGCTFNYVVFG